MRAASIPAAPGTGWSLAPAIGARGPAKRSSSMSCARRSATLALRASRGLPAASRSRNRLTRGSSGTVEEKVRLQTQRFACRRGPCTEIDAVVREHGHDQAVDAERDAARVRGLAAVVAHVPHVAEVLAVIVEAHARGGRCLGGVRVR